MRKRRTRTKRRKKRTVITESCRRILKHGTLAHCGFLLLLLPVAALGFLGSQPTFHFIQSAPQAPKNDYALIYGTVWGPDKHPQAGVPITIRRASGKKAKWELISDSRGEFAQRVPTGAQDYVIQADITMPKGQPKPEVTVHIDDNERKDVSLHLDR
jgi:hypothetical protein